VSGTAVDTGVDVELDVEVDVDGETDVDDVSHGIGAGGEKIDSDVEIVGVQRGVVPEPAPTVLLTTAPAAGPGVDVTVGTTSQVRPISAVPGSPTDPDFNNGSDDDLQSARKQQHRALGGSTLPPPEMLEPAVVAEGVSATAAPVPTVSVTAVSDASVAVSTEHDVVKLESASAVDGSSDRPAEGTVTETVPHKVKKRRRRWDAEVLETGMLLVAQEVEGGPVAPVKRSRTLAQHWNPDEAYHQPQSLKGTKKGRKAAHERITGDATVKFLKEGEGEGEEYMPAPRHGPPEVTIGLRFFKYFEDGHTLLGEVRCLRARAGACCLLHPCRACAASSLPCRRVCVCVYVCVAGLR
jgi:hypothetical protein